MSIAELKSTAAALVIALTLPGCGLMAPAASPGYAEFVAPGWQEADTILTLSLGPTLLRIAAQNVEDDPEVRTMLGNLEGVRIRIYALDDDTVAVTEKINEMGAALRDKHWEPVIQVRDEGETVHMLAKTVDGDIVGLVLMAIDDRELVMVNVMGSLQPDMLDTAMAALTVE